jgi:hypothetical protein
VLKLGLIVVGLDRAPANLFHPRHSNPEIVKVLGSHHDSVVSQYTVWAIAENDSLGLSDLGIPISSIETRPPNVRSWMFQLIAMSPATAKANLEYIELGAGDPHPEARLGLAAGLRETFYDGIEPLVLDWFYSESDQKSRRACLTTLFASLKNARTMRKRPSNSMRERGLDRWRDNGWRPMPRGRLSMGSSSSYHMMGRMIFSGA